jgi:anti-sigma factor RsiW
MSIFNEQLRAALRSEPLPQHLFESVRARYVKRSLPRSRVTDYKVRRHLIAAAAALAVLIAAAGTAGILIWPAGSPSVERLEVGEAPVNELRAFIDSGRPIDLITSDSTELRSWFTGKVTFTPPSPDPPTPEVHLLGGRLCFFMNRRIAAYMYRANGHLVALYVIPTERQQVTADKAGRRDIAGRTVGVRSLGGLTNFVWEDADLVFALISDMPEDAMMQLARGFAPQRS